MTINIAHIIFQVRKKINDLDIVNYDDKLVFNDLQEAYDYFVMLSDHLNIVLTDLREESLKRCLISLATFYGYRKSTRLVSTNPGAGTAGTSLNVIYDLNKAKTCIELLFGVKLDDDLIPITMERSMTPPIGAIGPSILDVFGE